MASTHAQRKRLGIFYTPPEIAEHLARALAAEATEEELKEPPAICDPFVGEGALLKAWVEAATARTAALWSVPSAQARRLLASTACGVDLSRCSLDRAVGALANLAGGASGGALRRSISSRLVQMDALLAPIATDDDEGASWEQAFPAVFARGGFDFVIANPPWEKVRVNDREFFSEVEPGFSRLPRPRRDALRADLLESPDVAKAYHAYRARVAALKRAARLHYDSAGSGGDLDTYKLAVERAVQILRPGGLAGLIVPHGLLGDWGARKLRRLLLHRDTIAAIVRLETGRAFFPEIHANLGVALLIIRRRAPSPGRRIAVSPSIDSHDRLRDYAASAVPMSLVAEATPHAMIPLVDGPEDLAFLERGLAFPRLGEWPDFSPRREIDMTNDRRAFRRVGAGVPLLEGKHLRPFAVAPGDRKYDVASASAAHRKAMRVAWRAVADRAMRRRLVASWIPFDVALGNSLVFATGSSDLKVEDLLWLLAFLNGRAAEAQLRLWCANNNINIFHIRSCRAPRFELSGRGREVVGLAAGLTQWAALAPIPAVVSRLATPLRSKSDAIDAVEAIDDYWKTRYDLPEKVWSAAVDARTGSVANAALLTPGNWGDHRAQLP